MADKLKRWRGGSSGGGWGIALIVMPGSPPRVVDESATPTTYVEPWQVHVQLGPFWADVRGRIEDYD